MQHNKRIDNRVLEDETYADSITERGNDYYRQGEFDKAIGDYSRALELNPQYTLAYIYRGDAFKAQKKLPEAIADYSKALETDDSNPANRAKAYNNRATIYYQQKELPKALADLNKALQLDPKYAMSYNNRGIFYHGQMKYAQAINDYTKALELNPKLGVAYFNRGKAYQSQKKNEAAIADYTQALELNPTSAMAYLNRGKAYEDQMKLDNAFSDYIKAQELDSKLINLNTSLASIYKKLGDASRVKNKSADAISQYTKALELNPKSVEIYFNRAQIYESQKRIAHAICDYLEVVKLQPGMHDSIYQILKDIPKLNIFNALKQLPEDTAVNLLAQSLNKQTLLGKIFSARELFENTKETENILKKIKDLYNFLSKEKIEVRRAARLIFQGSRSQNSRFFQIPSELGAKIAAFVAQTLAPEEAIKIAYDYYSEPIPTSSVPLSWKSRFSGFLKATRLAPKAEKKIENKNDNSQRPK